MRHVNLDPVSAMIKLLARSFTRLDRAIHDLRALWHIQFGRIAFEWISSRGGNRARGNEQPRPRNVSGFNRLLYFDIPITRAFCLEVAQCSESLLQSASHGNR